jgi:hypothetical protein
MPHPTVLCRGLEKSLPERHGRSTAEARHRHGMVCVNQTRPHCVLVNQVGKTQSKPLATRHSRETAWARHAMCELAFIVPSASRTLSSLQYSSDHVLSAREGKV